MIIERTSKEVIIRLPSNINMEGLQRLVDYLTYKEATAKSKAKQPEVDKLAADVKKAGGQQIKAGWLNENYS